MSGAFLIFTFAKNVFTDFIFTLMRFFAELQYKGTDYVGWQRQPNGTSIQASIEEALTKILGQSVAITGCGRTDAGVHASQFFIHFDHKKTLADDCLKRMNQLLDDDIFIRRIFQVHEEAHARFDATKRSYEYHIGFHKDPFKTDLAYFFPNGRQLDQDLMQKAANLLLQYDSFYPFCKSNTDVKTMECMLYRSEWDFKKDEKGMIFHVSANRFLRGMVRLIVGMCLNIGQGKLQMEQLLEAMDLQERLPTPYSVPARGLFLTQVVYPYEMKEIQNTTMGFKDFSKTN